MEKRVLVIVPTRGRPEKSVEFYEAFAATSRISDLCFGLDDDDVEYPRIDGVIYEVNPRMRMNGTLNYLAKKYADSYEYIAFLGDDHRPRTHGWDYALVQEIQNLKHGIAYGNDLYQGANLPTAVLLKSSFIKALGYMAPPELTHLYLDNFWRDMGRSLGTLRYRDDIVIEHMHYTLGKSEADAGYLEVNDHSMFEKDKIAYFEYLDARSASDMEKLRA